MDMTRRAFGKLASVGLFMLATGSMFLTGCNVLQSILNWVPVGIKALQSILTLLQGAGIVLGGNVSAIVGLITTGFTDLSNAIAEYKSTTPPPAGALAKIDTFLTDLVDNFQGLLNNLPPIGGTLETLIVGIAEIVLTTIAGFLAELPASMPLPKFQNRMKVTFRRGTHQLNTSPIKRSNARFAADINGQVNAAAAAGSISKLTAKEAQVHLSLQERF